MINDKLRAPILLSALLLIFSVNPVESKNLRWPKMRGKKLITFDWNCSTPQSFPGRALGKLAKRLIPKSERHFSGNWADRAFYFRLHAQESTVYFVPLTCGATGNCDWALFTVRPRKYIGKISGQFFYTYQSADGWPQIIADTRIGGSERLLTTYEFRKGRYHWLGDELTIRSIEPSKSPELPIFLRKSKKMCSNYDGG